MEEACSRRVKEGRNVRTVLEQPQLLLHPVQKPCRKLSKAKFVIRNCFLAASIQMEKKTQKLKRTVKIEMGKIKISRKPVHLKEV